MFTAGGGDLEGLCNAAVVETLTVLITRGFVIKCHLVTISMYSLFSFLNLGIR